MGEVVPIDIKLRQKLTALLNSVPPEVLLKILKHWERHQTGERA